jgi:hypothetical protein
MSTKPQYDINKIKSATDKPTFGKAVELYESGRVTQFKEVASGFSATVIGTQPYYVSISPYRFDIGGCNCYMGQHDILCKHMVAAAIYAVKDGATLSHDEKAVIGGQRCSGKIGELSDKEMADRKKEITEALKYIKPYIGPSRIWFEYQRSLDEGRNRIAGIVSGLPVSPQTAGLLVDLLLRMERKLMSGVDDFNGTASGCMADIVDVLEEFAKLVPECALKFKKLKNLKTSFGWEEPLVSHIKAMERARRKNAGRKQE